jgi:hypothetical protein
MEQHAIPKGLDLPYALGGAYSVADSGAVAFAQGTVDYPSEVALQARGSERTASSSSSII